MTTPKNKSRKKIINSLSDKKHIKGLLPENSMDVLRIVFNALNSTIGGFLITDKEGMITFVNPSFCKMFEYLPEEIMGKNAAELFSTKEIKSFSDVVTILDMSKDDTEEFIVVKRDNSSLIVEVSASNVLSVTGEIIGRMGSFVNITKRKKLEIEREKLIKKLQDAMDKIKILKGIIPICASCKKIRDDEGFWHQVEIYISEHSNADFSHGICPDCAIKLYPEFIK